MEPKADAKKEAKTALGKFKSLNPSQSPLTVHHLVLDDTWFQFVTAPEALLWLGVACCEPSLHFDFGREDCTCPSRSAEAALLPRPAKQSRFSRQQRSLSRWQARPSFPLRTNHVEDATDGKSALFGQLKYWLVLEPNDLIAGGGCSSTGSKSLWTRLRLLQ